MTENSFGNVVFDGVCTDLSNAAYPVEDVRSLVASEVDRPHRDTGVHIALTLIDEEVLVASEDGAYAVAEEHRDESDFEHRVCEVLSVRTASDHGVSPGEFARFVRLIRSVLDGVTRGDWRSNTTASTPENVF